MPQRAATSWKGHPAHGQAASLDTQLWSASRSSPTVAVPKQALPRNELAPMGQKKRRSGRWGRLRGLMMFGARKKRVPSHHLPNREQPVASKPAAAAVQGEVKWRRQAPPGVGGKSNDPSTLASLTIDTEPDAPGNVVERKDAGKIPSSAEAKDHKTALPRAPLPASREVLRREEMSLTGLVANLVSSPPHHSYFSRVMSSEGGKVLRGGTALSSGLQTRDSYGFAYSQHGAFVRDRVSGSGGGVGGGAGSPDLRMQNASQKGILRRKARRLAKWVAMRTNWDEVCKRSPRLVMKRVRKGIPMQLRSSMWARFLGVPQQMHSQPGHYHALCQRDFVPGEQHILLDASRVFTKHERFEVFGSEAQQQLFCVLRALAADHQDVGYCQALAFPAAFLLLFMPEEQTFWSLRSLLQHPRLDLVSMYAPGIPQALMHLQILESLLLRCLPRLHRHLQRLGVFTHMYALDWFMTVTTCAFPLDLCTRVWDVLLWEMSWNVLYEVFLATLKSSQSRVLASGSFDVAMAVLRTAPSRITDPEQLLRDGRRMLPSARKLRAIALNAAEILTSSPRRPQAVVASLPPSPSPEQKTPSGSGLVGGDSNDEGSHTFMPRRQLNFDD